VISARRALQRLREGNRRFVESHERDPSQFDASRRLALVRGQAPHAIILGCSDSRVPAEIVFDQGLGDLFVIRVAGNIVAPSQVGSVEFAADRFGTRLVVVLGHSRCGAVAATLSALTDTQAPPSPNLRSIVDRIRPHIHPLWEASSSRDPDTLIREAVRANIRASVDHLKHGSELLETLGRESGLLVVGAEYSLESGVVDFFEGLPRDPSDPQ